MKSLGEHRSLPLSAYGSPKCSLLCGNIIPISAPVFTCLLSMCLKAPSWASLVAHWVRICLPALFKIVRTWKQLRCLSTDEWIKKLWNIYTMEYDSAIKRNKVSSSEVDEPRAYYTEQSKSEREKQMQYINAYVWNLGKWYWWIYLQSRNRDADEENCGLMGTAGKRVGGTIERTALNTYITICK